MQFYYTPGINNFFFFTTHDMDIRQQVITSFAKVIGFIVHSDLFLNI